MPAKLPGDNPNAVSPSVILDSSIPDSKVDISVTKGASTVTKSFDMSDLLALPSTSIGYILTAQSAVQVIAGAIRFRFGRSSSNQLLVSSEGATGITLDNLKVTFRGLPTNTLFATLAAVPSAVNYAVGQVINVAGELYVLTADSNVLRGTAMAGNHERVGFEAGTGWEDPDYRAFIFWQNEDYDGTVPDRLIEIVLRAVNLPVPPRTPGRAGDPPLYVRIRDLDNGFTHDAVVPRQTLPENPLDRKWVVPSTGSQSWSGAKAGDRVELSFFSDSAFSVPFKVHLGNGWRPLRELELPRGIAAWALGGNTDAIPPDKLPALIARLDQLEEFEAEFRTTTTIVTAASIVVSSRNVAYAIPGAAKVPADSADAEITITVSATGEPTGTGTFELSDLYAKTPVVRANTAIGAASALTIVNTPDNNRYYIGRDTSGDWFFGTDTTDTYSIPSPNTCLLYTSPSPRD